MSLNLRRSPLSQCLEVLVERIQNAPDLHGVAVYAYDGDNVSQFPESTSQVPSIKILTSMAASETIDNGAQSAPVLFTCELICPNDQIQYLDLAFAVLKAAEGAHLSDCHQGPLLLQEAGAVTGYFKFQGPILQHPKETPGYLLAVLHLKLNVRLSY